MRLITLIILFALGALALSTSTGCETVKGLGKDMHDASSTVQNAFAVE